MGFEVGAGALVALGWFEFYANTFFQSFFMLTTTQPA